MEFSGFFEEDDPQQLTLLHLAQRFALITEAELKAQYKLWNQSGQRLGLGDQLLEQGFLDFDQLQHLLRLQSFLYTRRADRQFAEMAVETGLTSEDEINYALSAQESAFRQGEQRKLGDLLVEFGSMEEETRDELLKQQGRS